MEIRIRRGRRTDYEALSALGAWPSVENDVRRSIRMYRRVVSDLAVDLYVADERGETVGLVMVSYARVLGLGGQRATLEELVVRPDRRGAGIARRLLEHVIRRAQRRGVRSFRAVPGDDRATRFLEHAGFRASGAVHEWPVGAGRE
jgi:GNAT superfamily N-acetyltransferase